MKNQQNDKSKDRHKASIWAFVVCSTAAAVVAGCGVKQPMCGDEASLSLVREVVMDEIVASDKQPSQDPGWSKAFKTDSKIEFLVVRTTSQDQKIGKANCAASMVTTFPEGAKTWLSNTMLPDAFRKDYPGLNMKIDGLNLSTDIQYSSQMTDDKKSLLVEVQGFSGVVEAASLAGRYGSFKPKVVVPEPNVAMVVPAAPSADAEIAAAKDSPKRTVAGVTLQAFECGDTCQLKYVDASGTSQTAICTDTKGCQSWASEPKVFVPLIGAKADLFIGQKYILEGGVTMDNVVGISLADGRAQPESK